MKFICGGLAIFFLLVGLKVSKSSATKISWHTLEKEPCCGVTLALAKTTRNWLDAEKECKAIGMELATINTEKKFNCLIDFIKTSGLPEATNFWTGGNDLLKEGEFRWSSRAEGETFITFYPGGHNQPDNNGGIENCVSLRKVYPGNNIQNNYGMNDEVCSLDFSFICEVSNCTP